MAHQILLSSDALESDPWLISAEIVAAGAAGKESRLIKRARRMVESERIHPRHTSELASAIGTLEHEAGNRKQVRRLFGHALLAPTENTVAQASWIERHMPGFEVPDESLRAPRAFEALAWEAVQLNDYDQAVSHSLEWAEDEPFATRPVLFGSWVASMGLGDYTTAAQMTQAARVANPDDPRLVAQLLYALASSNNIQGARELLPELERLTSADGASRTRAEWDVVLEADRGLIAFRTGDSTSGRTHYERALEIAAENRLPESAATALVNYARELYVSSSERMDGALLEAAAAAFPASTRGVVEAFISRIDS
ncbi:MAG: hypothetical protein WBI63_00140 [Coriobacteriia bacterium]